MQDARYKMQDARMVIWYLHILPCNLKLETVFSYHHHIQYLVLHINHLLYLFSTEPLCYLFIFQGNPFNLYLWAVYRHAYAPPYLAIHLHNHQCLFLFKHCLIIGWPGGFEYTIFLSYIMPQIFTYMRCKWRK